MAKQALQAIAAMDGIEGCALVELRSGMVWYYAGALAEIEHLAEAAIELWRVQDRLAEPWSSLGSAQSMACSFASRVVAFFPCDATRELVLVCVADKSTVQWSGLTAHMTALREEVQGLR